ncbi:MAG: FG-GAP-like repeat-containing protein [Prevotellaceae bacterium]|jgi:RHS repeat-associated protein|nr:FG-GAP-like repeat-containing protein [Prevotellaceae bacterium]
MKHKFLSVIIFIALFAINAEAQTISTMPATAAVSPTGAANYQIPIEVPPGTNGFQPNISITYNSQGGFGAMGQGWDIGGLSAITRGTKNFYYDGDIILYNAMQFNDSDVFYLDGQRLILLSGTHFTVGAVYGTEVEDYSRVTIKNYSGRKYFELKTLDGQIFEYGKGSSMMTPYYFESDAEDWALAWKISSAKDAYGNVIKYQYTPSGQYLKKIQYTNNENYVEFYYSKNFKNPQKKFFGSVANIQDSVLYAIKTYNANSRVKQYTFNYTDSYIDKQLTTITLENYLTNTVSSTTTNIGYGEESTIQNIELNNLVDVAIKDDSNSYLYSGDVDGDGYPDKIELWKGKKVGSTYQNGYIRVYRNSGNDTVQFPNPAQFCDKFVPKLLVADLNNDGKDEIVLLSIDTTNNVSMDNIVIKVYSYNVSNHTLEKKSTTDQYSPQVTSKICDYGYSALLTNINGDMYPDLMIVPYKIRTGNYIDHDDVFDHNITDINIGVQTFRYNTLQYNFTFIEEQNVTLNSAAGVWNSPQIGDFNSDGEIDFMHILTQDAEDVASEHHFRRGNILESKDWGGSNLFEYDGRHIDGCLNCHTYIPYFENFYAVDVNSDNRTDIIVQNARTHDNGKWQVMINAGLNAVPITIETNISPAYSHPNGSYTDEDDQYPIFLDYNGDGYIDMVVADEVYNDNGYQYTEWKFYRNNNGVFEVETAFVSNQQLSHMQPVVMDINNDGIADIVYAEGTKYKAYTKPNANRRSLVTKITNGLGQVDIFTYTNYSGYTIPANTTVRSLNAPVLLVAQHIQSDGNIINYTFSNAKMHETKGFLGFGKISAENITNNTIIISTFALVNTFPNSLSGVTKYFNMSLQEQKLYVGKGELASTQTYVNINKSAGLLPNLRYIMVPYSVTTTDRVRNLTTNTNYIFDNFGRQMFEQSIAGEYITETNYVYSSPEVNVSNISYSQFLPQTKTVTNIKRSETISKQTAFVYYPNGQIQRQTDFNGLAKNIITDFEYFTTGNLKKATITVTDLTPQVTQYGYDALYRLPTSQTNTLGQVSSKTYDFRNGNVLSETGIDGLQTNYIYNNAGYLSRKDLPNGQSFYISTYFDINHGAKYRVHEYTNSPTWLKTTWYDIYGREVHAQQTGANGETLNGGKIYNSKGQLQKEIHPHRNADAEIYTEYIYDIYGRDSLKTVFDGINNLTTSYEYDRLKTTITNPDGTTNTTVNNTAGLVVSHSDNGGNISYEYNAAGQQTKITAADGSQTSIQYDEYGNRSVLTDPNAGEILTEYYPNGLLYRQTNAKGDVTVMKYDAALRESTKTITNTADQSLVYIYSYVPTGNGIGQIASVEYLEDGNLIHSQSFSYNLHHLLTGKIDTYEGIPYPFSYTYDGLWRPQTKTSPSGLVTEYVYNIYGQVNQIKANDAPVWTLTTQNVKGQITDFALGNDIVSHYGYKDNGLLEDIVSTHNTTVLQHFSYGYDNRYNLTARNNEKTGKHENFIYDNLSRFTEAKLNGTTYLQQYYRNENGNINYKSDVGKYGYGQRPHAVEAIDTTKITRENGITDDKQILEYTSFNKVSRVLQQVDYLPQEEYTIFYGVNQQRIKTFYYQTGTLKFFRYYLGTYEKEIGDNGTTHIDYIYAPTGLAAIRKVNDNNEEIYFVSNDNMNSVQLVTDHHGDIVNEFYYTPWGGRTRIDNTGLADITDRGYTGHEHLTALGLINMNGRIYDPTLARFLSPDPYVQAPDFSQGFNRYSYCLNNPFKYTDPTGEKWWHWLLGAAFLGVPMLVDPASTIAGISTIGMATYTMATATSAAVSFTMSAVDFTTIFWGTLFTGDTQEGGRRFANWAKIEAARFTGIVGNFYFDKTANVGEWGLQVFNAITLGYREVLQNNVGNILTHALNIGGKVEQTGFYQGRLISRTPDNTLKTAISFGDYITGDQIAMNPNDIDYDIDLFAHEFGHTYQSKITGAMYLFRYGIASAAYQGATEYDANKRAAGNGLPIGSWRTQNSSTYKSYEFIFMPVLWPFMWMWNY